jgi:hypothetical protein
MNLGWINRGSRGYTRIMRAGPSAPIRAIHGSRAQSMRQCGSRLPMNLDGEGRDGFHPVQLDFEWVHASVDAVEGVPTFLNAFMAPNRVLSLEVPILHEPWGQSS